MSDRLVLVTGAKGQLGTDVMEALKVHNITAVGIDREDVELTDKVALSDYLHRVRPTHVIHCAAYTAVDQAEKEPEICFLINERATADLAHLCQEIHAVMVYISTDYVFDGSGESPWSVDDQPNPQTVYGQSKYAGELAVKAELSTYFIVRIAWAFGIHGKNFVNTMLHLAQTNTEVRVVNDQFGSPTSTADLSELLVKLICSDQYGTVHATNEGYCSWAEFAQAIFEQVGLPTRVIGIPSEAYPTLAKRPHNSRLSKDSIDGFGRLPHWRDALATYLKALNKKTSAT
jgi:dTDP-4-dehydrorhamnose reductase